MKCLEGFHICAVWGMSDKRPDRNKDRSWTYPRLEDMLKAVSLKSIAHYVDVRRQTIANFIFNQPIHELCVGAVMKRGLLVQPFLVGPANGLEFGAGEGILAPPQPGQGPCSH
jgi:hypothetical protein